MSRWNRSSAVSNSARVRCRVVTSWVTTSTERTAVTAPGGTFAIGGLLPGSYQIEIQDTGFVPYRGEVTVTAGLANELISSTEQIPMP